eukprot:TRINITY_DN15904_c0_g1_i3.p1 TRINITY_DN15904_c0_g1~~TRINITY_DN15904_c0_g1_i3.p1  ORF type:complete len:372 (+),score=37.10 TRINITY_DN15904_c0_g1_i3:147-1118(+)
MRHVAAAVAAAWLAKHRELSEGRFLQRIPNVVHFVYGLAPSSQDEDLPFPFLLNIVSALLVIVPDALGPWWSMIKSLRIEGCVSLRQVRLPPLAAAAASRASFAHLSDWLRLQVLKAEGGIYLDIDVLALNSFDALRATGPVVLGVQGFRGCCFPHSFRARCGVYGLCNAVILAEPNASFVEQWWAALRGRTLAISGIDSAAKHFRELDAEKMPKCWDCMSVKFPWLLAQAMRSQIHIVPESRAFFQPNVDCLQDIFKSRRYDIRSNYALHLWESASWRPFLSQVTPATLRDANCSGGGGSAYTAALCHALPYGVRELLASAV